jgi:hypothetical protein
MLIVDYSTAVELFSCRTASYNTTLVGTAFAIVLPCALLVFRRIRKIAKSACELRHVCLSVRMEQLCSQ